VKRFAFIELSIFAAAIVLFGTISGIYYKGWAVDAAYGLIALYPLYLVRHHKDLFRPMLGVFLCYMIGRLVQEAPPTLVFSYTVVAYGFLALYNCRYDRYGIAGLCLAAVVFAPLYAAVGPQGAVNYLFQLIWNLMHVSLLVVPVSRIPDGEEEKGHSHRHHLDELSRAA